MQLVRTTLFICLRTWKHSWISRNVLTSHSLSKMFYLTDFSIIFVVDNSAEWIWRAISFCDGEQELGILVVGWISCPKTKTGLIFSILLPILPGEINMEEFVDGCLRYIYDGCLRYISYMMVVRKKDSETAGRFFPFLANSQKSDNWSWPRT